MDEKFYQHVCEQVKKMSEDLEDLLAIKSRYESRHPEALKKAAAQDAMSNLPTAYDVNLTLLQKVYAILVLIQRGTSEDVAKKWLELEPDIDTEKAKRSSNHYLSKLFTGGKIKAQTGGARYVYYLE